MWVAPPVDALHSLSHRCSARETQVCHQSDFLCSHQARFALASPRCPSYSPKNGPKKLWELPLASRVTPKKYISQIQASVAQIQVWKAPSLPAVPIP